MDNDIFYNPTKVIFGRNTELLVGDEVAKYGDKVLLHYGGGSAERSGPVSYTHLDVYKRQIPSRSFCAVKRSF